MNGKRWVTTLIAAAMLLICAGTVYADKTITGLGTGAITDPKEPDGPFALWLGSTVYYGT